MYKYNPNTDMILTKEGEVFQKLLADVEWLKSVATQKYYVNFDKYVAGCDPYKEEIPPKPIYKEGDWVLNLCNRGLFKVKEVNYYMGSWRVISDINGLHFPYNIRLAAEDEIREHLIREAIRRDLVANRRFKWDEGNVKDEITTILPNFGYEYFTTIDVLLVAVKEKDCRRAIYKKGKWAIPIFTKELPKTVEELRDILNDFRSDNPFSVGALDTFLIEKGYK